ncbi:ATP-binding protein [Streptomyces daliensis]
MAFTPEPVRVGHVRRITAAFLGLWDVEPLVESVVLAVSELVTNAVRHGTGDVGLRVVYVPGELRVEVSDGSAAPAELRSAADDDESGRGLFLVAVLAQNWGVTEVFGLVSVRVE